MKSSHCLGLVGGLGVGATVHYYEQLAKAHEAQGHRLDIVIVHAETPSVFEYVAAGDRDGLAQYLLSFIHRLHAAGAQIIAIPAVTPHFCLRELAALSPLPVVSIFEPLVQELAARSVRRAAVFGTRFVMESGLFGFAGDVEMIRPKPEELTDIHDIYVELARLGKGSAEQHRRLTEIAHALLRRDGVDAILLAGTDLTLLFDDTNTSFPSVDCAALHLRAILHQLFDEMPRQHHGKATGPTPDSSVVTEK